MIGMVSSNWPAPLSSSELLLLLLLFVSFIILEIWSTKLWNPFKINEMARPLGTLHLGQNLVSPPGPPNKVSIHLWHPTRAEHAWKPTRGVLQGTHLHIQHENFSSIDSNNEKLNLLQKATSLYPSLCPFISDTFVIKFSKISTLWVPTRNLLVFGNDKLGTISSKVCHRLSRSCSFTENTFLDPTFHNSILNFKDLKPHSYFRKTVTLLMNMLIVVLRFKGTLMQI